MSSSRASLVPPLAELKIQCDHIFVRYAPHALRCQPNDDDNNKPASQPQTSVAYKWPGANVVLECPKQLERTLEFQESRSR